MLQLTSTFDLQKDVVWRLLTTEKAEGSPQDNVLVADPQILNVERDEGVLYSWNLLYTFDKQVFISSCSLNREETLLVSKYLTLLIEIQPVNNTKVIKAVDCRVKVQFLYPDLSQTRVMESHLLVAAEDGYIDHYHILLGRQEGCKIVMQNSEHLVKDRVTDEFCWAQWDLDNQRLFFLSSREKYVLKCVQFFPDHNFETLFELPLELPSNLFTSVSHPWHGVEDYTYTIAFVHTGFTKTFTVALEQTELLGNVCSLQPLFISLGHYVVVYLAGHFLHLINCIQQDLLCHSLFLSGTDAHVETLEVNSVLKRISGHKMLDGSVGRIYTVNLNQDFLLQLLSTNRPEAQRLAALHCLVIHLEPDQDLEKKIIYWITENMMSFNAFDQIQEFILGSVFRKCCQQSLSLNKVISYSSVFEKKELPVALTAIPGVKCTPDLLAQPIIKGKARSLQGYWTELQSIIDRTKYLETVPNPRYRFSQTRGDWTTLQATMSPVYKRTVPLFQEVDQPQRMLLGLIVDKLREHLNKNLPQLGKKKIETLVVNYMAKLRGSLEEWTVFHSMCRILEATEGLCLPLPPGYFTLLSVLGVRCVPHRTFLQYVDHGFLHLTEPFVSRLMTDLDNGNGYEELKFGVLKRLPENLAQRVCQLWDHPVSSACITRQYVRKLLEKYTKTKVPVQLDRHNSSSYLELLPLRYLIAVLSDMEERASNPFEEPENVDARFVEEIALKQTLITLGFEDK
ncbi:Gamma-secretase-activating protein [Bagarius yarrelli]|uniref:Gamma-secretase-activating protein n=1 Tax=Bagarius yarrelli TaxID=175774 RepID=A0A556TIA2_BAGYA|nr:Gamma-secretase-activating protein [Bagarius yarrelli]